MQGVRSSSLLGSILENTVVDRVFSGHMTAFLCSSAPRVLPGLSYLRPFLLTILLIGKNLLHMAEQKWLQGLRRQIKHSCGPGWGLPLVSSTRSAPNCLHETPSKAPSTVYGQATEALTPYARRVGVLQA
jgi:hypothetical protein